MLLADKKCELVELKMEFLKAKQDLELKSLQLDIEKKKLDEMK